MQASPSRSNVLLRQGNPQTAEASSLLVKGDETGFAVFVDIRGPILDCASAMSESEGIGLISKIRDKKSVVTRNVQHGAAHAATVSVPVVRVDIFGEADFHVGPGQD